MHRALAELPEQERKLIELAYWGGLSQSEIAEFLDIPLGTVKTRTRSALSRLADVLEGALMSRPPHFGDLVGNDLSPAERERLERVHDMLVAAGPPPELPQGSLRHHGRRVAWPSLRATGSGPVSCLLPRS